ncbi:MAG: hypothetical protein FWC82_03025 [Firmicutes bacterium]|nr:hypothetical protein [Bacillota bacterium]
MRNKKMALIVGLVLSLAIFLAACGWIEIDQRRDAQQIVATVASIEDADVGFSSGDRHIFKFELMSTLNQHFGPDRTEEDVNEVLDNLIERELLTAEIERLIARGERVIQSRRMFELRAAGISYRRIDDLDERRAIDRDILNGTRRLATDDYNLWFDGLNGRGSAAIGAHETVNGGNKRLHYRAIMDPGEFLRWRAGEQLVFDPDTNGYYIYSDYAHYNEVKEILFDTIDQELRSIQQRILRNAAIETDETGEQVDPPEPPHPVRPPEFSSTIYPEERWSPSDEPSRIPGRFGSIDRVSLERQSLSELVLQLTRSAEDNLFFIESEYREWLDRSEEFYREMIDARRTEELYLGLVDIDNNFRYSFPIYLLLYRQVRRQTEMQLLQQTLNRGITVSNADVVRQYNAVLNQQRLEFSRNPAAYTQAAGGNDLVLFRPNGRYFYVKHILVPFSDAQTARLAAYRARPGVTAADVTRFRDGQLFNEIRHFPRVDGWEDFNSPRTARQIFDEVVAAVSPLSDDLTAATRRWHDFILKYNTDPGAMNHVTGNQLGYVVQKVLEDWENPTYMQEFEDGARWLYRNATPGSVHPQPVITDFGMHIMFFAMDTAAGMTLGLQDYTTPAQQITVFDHFYHQIHFNIEQGRINDWRQAQLVTLTQNENFAQTFPRRFRDLF